MLRQDFSLNQVFRIAIVPGYFSSTVDTSDYNAVMSALSEKNGGVTIESINWSSLQSVNINTNEKGPV
jgi:hypothetical protein